MPHVVITLTLHDRLLLLPALGVVLGVIWAYRGSLLLKRKRLILKTPASKIRAASMGLVEVSGLACGPFVLLSPLKKIECYYHRSVAWEWKKKGRAGEWVKVAEETLHVPFYVDDSTDRVLVDARGADTHLHCDFNEQYHQPTVDGGPEMPGSVSDFLVRNGADPSKQIRVEEYCIKPHSFLFVLGTLSQNPGIDASITPAWAHRVNGHPSAGKNAPQSVQPVREEIIHLSGDQEALPITEMTQQQKIAAALAKAGMHNPKTWTGQTVSKSPVKTSSTSSAANPPVLEETTFIAVTGVYDLHPPVVLMKGTHEPTFFISWRSQRDVVGLRGWKSQLTIWGGPVLIALSVCVLLAKLIRL